MLDLYKFIKNYKRLSIIGMEKNVGKTTLLNKLINDISNKKIIGLTSVGRDGEEVDLVTSTQKPKIYIRRGTIIATARNCIRNCDITKEILYSTDYNTPMGNIIILRALSDGYVDIAGPSYNKQMKDIINIMESYGSEIIIIDGALGRKSTAISEVSEATILSTGAALSLDIQKVIEETKKTSEFLMLKQVDSDVKKIILENFDDNKSFIIKNNGEKEKLNYNNTIDLSKNLKNFLSDEIAFIFVKGAITSKIIEVFIQNREAYKNIKLIIEDGTKLFIDSELFKKVKMSGVDLQVVNKVNLLFITCNPHSPLGIDFDKNELKNRLKDEISIPVVDILGDQDEFY